MSTPPKIRAEHAEPGQMVWVLSCDWCGGVERVPLSFGASKPVSDNRNRISTLAGWEAGQGLLVCPACVQLEEWLRLG